MVNGSAQHELNRFFQVLNNEHVSESVVSAAALCKARKKLSNRVFYELNSTLVDTFYESTEFKTWNNFRLLAVDGSVTKLPCSDELLKHFGVARSCAKYPAVRMSQLYDLNNKLTVDLQIESHSVGERNMALCHLEKTSKNDLILYDRGYPAVWFFKMHLEKGVHFCSRVKHDFSNETKAFLETKSRDRIVELPCVEKSLRRCRKEGLSTESIKIRLIKVILPSGKKEVLATSLTNQAQYPYEIFSSLYQRRWGIEEDYKIMKCRTTIENYSGISVEAVLQDIRAKVLTKNIAAIAIFEADKIKEKICQGRKAQYQINFTQALGLLKDNIVRLLKIKRSHSIVQKIVIQISKMLNAKRLGRKFKRKDTRRYREKYPMKYKRYC